MKIAIVYATVGGATKECAALLKNELGTHDVALFELGKDEFDLSEFDLCVIGFPIRMGKAHKTVRRFFKERIDELKERKMAYYLCCGFVDCFEEYAAKCIPAELLERAVDVACLGGSLDHKRFRGFDRLIVKAVRNEILGGGDNADQRTDMTLPTVMEENISQFAVKLKGF
jgi:menaquinone-dependent protoporphyrinogen oxidase